MGRVRLAMLPLDGNASTLEWSPDGDRLVVALAPTPLIDDTYMSRRLRIVDVASGSVLTRIENPGKLGQVGWSPDGERVAFVSAESINDPKEGRLMVADASDGEFSRMCCPDSKAISPASRGESDRTLAYVSDEGVETRWERWGGWLEDRTLSGAETWSSRDVGPGRCRDDSVRRTVPHLSRRTVRAARSERSRGNDGFEPVAGRPEARPAGGRGMDRCGWSGLQGMLIRPLGCRGRAGSHDRCRSRRAGGSLQQRLADRVLVPRPGGGRAGVCRVLPELSGQHRAGRRIQHARPGRLRRQGIRRHRRWCRLSDGSGRHGFGPGRRDGRLIRRLRNGLAHDSLLRSVSPPA